MNDVRSPQAKLKRHTAAFSVYHLRKKKEQDSSINAVSDYQ